MQNNIKVFYSVKHITCYDGWGNYSVGSTIKNFTSLKEAQEFCKENYKTQYESSYPEITIIKEVIENAE